jgi:hypothetical protein
MANHEIDVSRSPFSNGYLYACLDCSYRAGWNEEDGLVVIDEGDCSIRHEPHPLSWNVKAKISLITEAAWTKAG